LVKFLDGIFDKYHEFRLFFWFHLKDCINICIPIASLNCDSNEEFPDYDGGFENVKILNHGGYIAFELMLKILVD
jgi:hypothetical protein